MQPRGMPHSRGPPLGNTLQFCASRGSRDGRGCTNYMLVSCIFPRHCWDAGAYVKRPEQPIWTFPEPPILFLLVGSEEMPKRQGIKPQTADVAQLVEHHLAKVDVASSNLVVRSQDTVTATVAKPGLTRWVGREARQRPAKPYTRVRIPYPPR